MIVYGCCPPVVEYHVSCDREKKRREREIENLNMWCNLWPGMSKFRREVSQASLTGLRCCERRRRRQQRQGRSVTYQRLDPRPGPGCWFTDSCARASSRRQKLLPILVDPSVNQSAALSLTGVKHSCGCLTNCLHAAHLFHSLLS